MAKPIEGGVSQRLSKDALPTLFVGGLARPGDGVGEPFSNLNYPPFTKEAYEN